VSGLLVFALPVIAASKLDLLVGVTGRMPALGFPGGGSREVREEACAEVTDAYGQ